LNLEVVRRLIVAHAAHLQFLLMLTVAHDLIDAARSQQIQRLIVVEVVLGENVERRLVKAMTARVLTHWSEAARLHHVTGGDAIVLEGAKEPPPNHVVVDLFSSIEEDSRSLQHFAFTCSFGGHWQISIHSGVCSCKDGKARIGEGQKTSVGDELVVNSGQV